MPRREGQQATSRWEAAAGHGCDAMRWPSLPVLCRRPRTSSPNPNCKWSVSTTILSFVTGFLFTLQNASQQAQAFVDKHEKKYSNFSDYVLVYFHNWDRFGGCSLQEWPPQSYFPLWNWSLHVNNSFNSDLKVSSLYNTSHNKYKELFPREL